MVYLYKRKDLTSPDHSIRNQVVELHHKGLSPLNAHNNTDYFHCLLYQQINNLDQPGHRCFQLRV